MFRFQRQFPYTNDIRTKANPLYPPIFQAHGIDNNRWHRPGLRTRFRTAYKICFFANLCTFPQDTGNRNFPFPLTNNIRLRKHNLRHRPKQNLRYMNFLSPNDCIFRRYSFYMTNCRARPYMFPQDTVDSRLPPNRRTSNVRFHKHSALRSKQFLNRRCTATTSLRLAPAMPPR